MMKINDYNPVADIYDTYVPATFDLPFFLSEAQKVSGEVLELMAGTGRVSLPLIEAGVKLTCVDNAADLLEILRRKLMAKGLTAEVVAMDVCQLDLGKQFASIIIPFHSFAHLDTVEKQKCAIERIYQHLLPEGNFICTLGNPKVRQAAVDGQLHLYRTYSVAGGKGKLLLWLVEKFNAEDKQVVETSEFFEEYDEQGVLYRKRLMELKFRLSSREEFEKLAGSVGFKVKAFYGDYSYGEYQEESSPYMIWEFGI
ncbi:MAG: class I SAM-dependent methyltransferase [Anaerolineaceae bacterium]|nr:class I SAM-dependent methyltransferase [Anaerolineaceae bacterium]